MRWLALVALAGCGGGGWEWEARAVIGVEPQRAHVASGIALWLHGETESVAYPLVRDGDWVTVHSAFAAEGIPATYDQRSAALALPALISAPLHGPGPTFEEYPGDLAFHGHVDVEVVPGQRVPVDLDPVLDPCAFGEAIRPEASSRGEWLPQNATSVIAAGFVLRVIVQRSCLESVE